MTYDINESEKERILNLYESKPFDHYIRERLNTCKFTKDGKYVLFEDNVFSCETGDLMPLSEKWTLSDTFHTIGDLVSVGMDFVIPGSGAVIDTINAISYVIEAQFKRDPKERTMLYVMGAITFAFVIIPGHLQAAIIPLKTFIKTGKGAGKPLVRKGLAIVTKSFSTILKQLPNTINRVLRTQLARRVFGKNVLNVAEKITQKTGYMEIALHRVLRTKSDDQLKVMTKKLQKREAEWAADLAKAGGDPVKARKLFKLRTWNKAGYKIGKGLGRGLSVLNVKNLKYFFKHPIKLMRGAYVVKKLGFIPGKSYAFVTTKGVVKEAKVVRGFGGGIEVVFKGQKTPTRMGYDYWLRGTIERPWALKGYVQSVPLFVKRMSELILPDGTDINYDAMGQLIDLDPDQTSMESLSWLKDELAEYEGNLGAYTVNTTVSAFQKALVGLGYPLSQFGEDGKFGPETQKALTQFQIDNQLAGSEGKMNRLTAERLAVALKDKNVPNSEELQKTLSTL